MPERPELKVLISSATIETERFSEFFGGAPVIQVEGRTFPVEVLYEPPEPELDLPEAVANAVAIVTSLDPRGDILVFLPGEREIRETERELAAQEAAAHAWCNRSIRGCRPAISARSFRASPSGA